MSASRTLPLLPETALQQVPELPYPLLASGKVREVYDLGDELLLIATDRLSAFDVILPDGIPGRGIILTQMSLFWFAQVAGMMENHLVADHDAALAERLRDFPELVSRSMLVRKLQGLPVEAVVRGYLAGSGWKEYQQTGELWGQALPEGLQLASPLPEPLFTPSTKAHEGHDEPLTLEACREILGPDHDEVVRLSLELFRFASKRATDAGLILADTKFEFGKDATGKLILMDEIFTPDSSRYWPVDRTIPGLTPEAFDKQFVRDYLESVPWDKKAPGPKLPAEIIAQTQERYLEAWQRLTQSD